jgi:hypothetical protein
MAVVINPDLLSVSEALRIKDELDRIGIPLSGICLNKRGVSKAEWSLDKRLADTPMFEVDFMTGGLSTREDLASIDSAALVADFMATDHANKGTP